MKYIKYYENLTCYISNPRKFIIELDKRNSFTYYGTFSSKSAIFAMVDLISKKSTCLADDNLRNIKIEKKNVRFENDILELYPSKIENLLHYRSSFLNKFIKPTTEKYFNDLKTLPTKIYKDIIFKYYPIIQNIVNNSKNFGDIIDNFSLVYQQITEDLELFINQDNYNI